MKIEKYAPILLLAALPFAGCKAPTKYEKTCSGPDGKVITQNYPNNIVSFEIKAPSLGGCCVESFTAWKQDGKYSLKAHEISCVNKDGPDGADMKSLDLLCDEKPPYPEPGTNYVIRGSPQAERLERNFYLTRFLWKQQQMGEQTKALTDRARRVK